MRKFSSNAVRDTNNGKIAYYGFRHPLVEHSFGKYMLRHQKCADGTTRKADNWWGGWSEDVSIDSLVRHVEDLQAIHAGYTVYKVRHSKDEEETIYLFKPLKNIPDNWNLVTKEDCYNAGRFNCAAGVLEHLKHIC